MCIAIVQMEGSIIAKDRLELCYKANDDGCGFAYSDNGKLHVYKTLDFEKFYKKYSKAAQHNPESKFLIHFRIGTQGKMNESNCHPFIINEDYAFIHNGTIQKLPKCDEHSDTWYFNDQILRHLPDGWFSLDAVHWLLEQSIGWSKLCILRASTNEVLIINESSGEWAEDGNWYSNKSYLPKPEYKAQTGFKYQSTTKYLPQKDYYQDMKHEWWVGSQRRRHDPYSTQLQAYDYDQLKWRNIDFTGAYLDEIVVEAETKDHDPMEECECCPGKFSRSQMYMARFRDDKQGIYFWMCEDCRQEMAEYIAIGGILLIGESPEAEHTKIWMD